MYFQLIYGALAVCIGYFTYTASGLDDPIKTILAAVFLVMAALIFLDIESDTGEDSDDE